MKNRKRLIAVVCLLVIGVAAGVLFLRGKPGNGGNSGDPDAKTYAKQALNVFSSLNAGNYQMAVRDFADGDRGPDLTPGQMELQWTRLVRTWGPCRKYYITDAQPKYDDRYTAYAVHVTCEFEKRRLYGVISFGPQKQITRYTLWASPQD